MADNSSSSGDYGTLQPLGSNISRNKDKIFNAPFLGGEMGAVNHESIPTSGVIATETATIPSGEVVEIEDMLAIFATDTITIEAGATIDGKAGSTYTYGTFGAGGEYDTNNWLPKAYARCVCEMQLNVGAEFEYPLTGGGSPSGGVGGAALFLAAPSVEIQAPSSIDLRGEGGGSGGHFGVVYENQFVYDDQATTGGQQSFTTPDKIDPSDI